MTEPVAESSEQFQTGKVAVLSAGHALHDTYTAFLPPLLPLIIESLALSKAEAGLLSSVLQAPSLLQPVIGHQADRRGLRTLVFLAPAVTAIAMSSVIAASGYATIALLLVVAGCSSACLHAIGPVLTGRLSGTKLGRGMGFWMVGGELGRTLGPLVIVSALQFLGRDKAYWVFVGGIATTLAMILLLRRTRTPSRGLQDDLPWRDALRAMRPLLLPLGAFIVMRAFLSVASTTYLPTFLSEEGSSLWVAGASLSLLEAAGVVGALTGGSISDRIGRRAVLVFATASSACLMLLFVIASGWPRMLLLLALGFTSLSVTPVIMALVQESFPRNRALANGIYMFMSFLLRSGVVVLVGGLGDRFGLHRAFTISALVTLLGVPTGILAHRQGQPDQQSADKWLGLE